MPVISAADARPLALRGTVTYDARCATVRGASMACELRPARFVVVRALDGNGEVVTEGEADAEGTFAIDTDTRAVALEVRAQSRADGFDLAVARDPAGARPHAWAAPIEDPAALDLHARDADGSLAGALHVLDTLRRGVDAVHRWTGATLPPVYVYWDRGVTREWSYYRGERPDGSGRFCVELLGGDPGAQASSDTDEHDEAIVLHELGHFVMDRLTGDSSLGGQHPRGFLIDPGLAWEEGRATWFATAVLGDPTYRDTIGLEPAGRVRVDESLETPQPPRGIGSETSVAGVLWDLSDGAVLPDLDGDGVALGPAQVLEAMLAIHEADGSYPSLPTFLRFLVSSGRVSEDGLRGMLAATGEPPSLLPSADQPLWPRDLEVGGRTSGKIDGLTQPAPSGGRNRPDTGMDAVHAFRVRAPRAGMLSVRLTIRGSGAPADHSDLDLELRDRRARVLDASRGTGATEAVARMVEPGWYVVYVRDGGDGNRADYELRVDLAPTR